MEERGWKRDQTMEAMRNLIENECEDERAADLIGKIKNGIDHWFTTVTEPGVELTNNRAERVLREHIVQRKMIEHFEMRRGCEFTKR